jgi:hypothetical protein
VIDRRRVTSLLGETSREIGILVFVFAPLDMLFQRGGPDLGVVILLIAGALILITLGTIIEAWEAKI